MQKQKKRRRHKKKVIVGTQIANLQRLVYDSDVPISLIDVESIFDISLSAKENKRNVQYEIEQLKKEMQNYAREITTQVIGGEKKKK